MPARAPRPWRPVSQASAARLNAGAFSMLLRWPARGTTLTGAPPSLAAISWCIAGGVSGSSAPTMKCAGARIAAMSPRSTCATVASSDLMYESLCSAAMLRRSSSRCSGEACGPMSERATGSAMSAGSLPASSGARRLSTNACRCSGVKAAKPSCVSTRVSVATRCGMQQRRAHGDAPAHRQAEQVPLATPKWSSTRSTSATKSSKASGPS